MMYYVAISILLLLTLFATGCNEEGGNLTDLVSNSLNGSVEYSDSEDASTDGAISTSTTKGSRDNTPIVYVPVASGSITYGNDSVTIDASNTNDGYIMVSYTGTNPKVKLQLLGSNGTTYTYNLHGGYESFPLMSDNGNYSISVFENISGSQYSTLYTQNISVTIDDKMLPFLYPNQYVNFTDNNATIQLGADITFSSNSDLETIQLIYNYVTQNIEYDFEKAANIDSGYISDIDDTIATNKGICLDYAAVMVAMLRSQRIPSKLEVGYAGDVYHAWISVHTDESGWVNKVIEFDGNDWKLMDPTFASNSSDSDLDAYIGDGSSYQTKYIY